MAAGLPLGAWALSLSEMPLALAVRGASLGIPVSSRLLEAAAPTYTRSRSPRSHEPRTQVAPKLVIFFAPEDRPEPASGLFNVATVTPHREPRRTPSRSIKPKRCGANLSS